MSKGRDVCWAAAAATVEMQSPSSSSSTMNNNVGFLFGSDLFFFFSFLANSNCRQCQSQWSMQFARTLAAANKWAQWAREGQTATLVYEMMMRMTKGKRTDLQQQQMMRSVHCCHITGVLAACLPAWGKKDRALFFFLFFLSAAAPASLSNYQPILRWERQFVIYFRWRLWPSLSFSFFLSLGFPFILASNLNIFYITVITFFQLPLSSSFAPFF